MKSSVPRTALRYAIWTGLLILTFDLLSDILAPDQRHFAALHLALAIFTLLILYLLLRRELRARERAEAQRRASEQRLANILDTAADAIIAINPDYRILVFNRGAEHTFGYRAQEVLGQSLDMLLPSRFSQLHRQHFRDFSMSPKTVRRMDEQREVFARRKDGTEFPAEASLSKLTQDGQTTFTVVLRDITQRRRAKEALRQAHNQLEMRVQERTTELAQANAALQAEIAERVQAEKEREHLLVQVARDRESIEELARIRASERDTLQTIMENTRTCLAYLDPQFNFVRVNSAYAQDSGHSQEELIGRNHFELFPNPENQAIFERVRDTGQPIEFHAKPFEFVDQPERGITYWDWTLAPVKDGDGHVQGLVLSLLDVTEHIRAKEALQKQRDFISAVLDTAGALVIVGDPQGRIVRFNRACEKMTGYSFDEVEGKYFGDLFLIPEEVEPVKAIFEELVAGEFPNEHENFWVTRDGSRRLIAWSNTALLDTRGSIEYLIGTGIDITERKQAEEALRKALQEARQREVEISALLAGSRAVLTYRDFADAARAIFDSCKHLVGAMAGYIALLTEDGTDNRIVYLDSGGLPCRVDPTLPMPIRGLRETAYRTGKPTYENNFPASEWTRFLPEGHARLDNVLFAPLLIKGITVGLLGLANKPGGFTENDVRMASAFGELAAIALFNSQTLESLENSEERFRSVAQSATEAIITIDSRATIVFWNKAATAIFGYSADEAIGQPLTLIIPRRFHATHRNGIERLASTGKSRVLGKTVEMTGLRKDGHEFPIELSLSTWKVRGEIFFTGIIHDVTERKRAEEELEWELAVNAALAETYRPLISPSSSIEDIASTILGQAKNLTGSAHGFVSSVDPETGDNIGHTLTEMLEGSCRVSEENRHIVFPRGSNERYPGLLGYSLNTHRAFYSNAPATHPASSGTPQGHIPIQRFLSVPVFLGKELVGQIALANPDRDYTQRDLEAIQRLAELYALAIQRIQAEEVLQERTLELSTLLEISRHAALTLELEPLLGLILDYLKAVINCASATIFRLEQGVLTALAYRGPVPQEDGLRLRFSLENTPIGRQMILSQKPVIIADVRGDTPLARDFREVIGAQSETVYGQVRSWMGVPLTIKDRVIGILALQHNESNHHYTPRQADLVLAFANQVAVAMENARLYEQAQALAAVEERQRLARDLHDAVSQTLFSASLSAEVLPLLWERNPDEGRRCLKEVQQLTRGALAEMRALLLELRPAALIEMELCDLLGQLAAAITSRAQTPVTLEVDEHRPLPPEVRVALYRIAQEALNNVAKHAAAGQVAVSLRHLAPHSAPTQGEQGGGVELRISDDGQGFSPESLSPQHLGLGIMRERAENIGATIEIQSQIGHGTQVAVVWRDSSDDEGRKTKDEAPPTRDEAPRRRDEAPPTRDEALHLSPFDLRPD